MKKPVLILAVSLLLGTLPSAALALDAACEPILAASEARIKVPAWRTVSEVNTNFKLETLKVDGKFYNRIDSGKWKVMPSNIDEAERTLLAQIRSGEVKRSRNARAKVTRCTKALRRM